MLEKTLKDIRDLRIQGATNVARESLKALSKFLLKSKAGNQKQLLEQAEKAKKKIFQTRVTEPLMRNMIRRVMYELRYNYDDDVKKVIERAVQEAEEQLKEFQTQEAQIVKNASAFIKNGSVIFTHCHSSSVVKTLELARKQGKKFEVICTETRPRWQGRMTAKDLTRAGIKTTMIVDSASMEFLPKTDMVLIGADAITHEGDVVNKIGTGLIGMLAKKFGKKVFVITHSMKYDPETRFKDEPIEQRKPEEVWKNPPKNLLIRNPAFEKLEGKNVDLIITELGAEKPKGLAKKVKKHYKWINI